MWEDKHINAVLAGFFVIYAFGFLFHSDPDFAGSLPGHLLGVAGTLLIFLTLIYPLKKRIFTRHKKTSDLRNHIAFGLLGPLLTIVHSAHQFASIISTLIFMTLFLVVFSGIIGRFLFRKVNQTLREQKRDYKVLSAHLELKKKQILEARSRSNSAVSASAPVKEEQRPMDWDDWIPEVSVSFAEAVQAVVDSEVNLKFFDTFKIWFSKWIRIHYLLSAFLFALIAVHVMVTIYYGLRWLP